MLLEWGRQAGEVREVWEARFWPCAHMAKLSFPLSVKERAQMGSSKGVNKDHSGYRGRKGARRNRKIS